MKLNFNKISSSSKRCGFTLAEVIFASAISVIALTGASSLYIYVLRSWHGIENRIEIDSDLNIAVSRMIYGVKDQQGIRAARGVSLNPEDNGWTLWYVTGTVSTQSNSISYSKSDKTMILNPGNYNMGRNISDAEITVLPNHIELKLEAEKGTGALKAKRNIATQIYWRN